MVMVMVMVTVMRVKKLPWWPLITSHYTSHSLCTDNNQHAWRVLVSAASAYQAEGWGAVHEAVNVETSWRCRQAGRLSV